MKDINLIPEEYFYKEKRNERLIAGIMFTILIFAVAVYFYMVPQKTIQALEEQIKNYDDAVVEYNILKNKLEQLEKSEEMIGKRLKVLDKISTDESKPTEVIKLIKEAMPQDVYLTELSYASPGVSLTCAAETASGVTEFYVELGKHQKFYNVVLSPVTKDDNGYNFTIQFSLTAGSDKNGKN